MSKIKTLLKLFIVMFKIGLFTFGGGYAMIAVIEREFVERKKWLEHDEFMDIIAIAESTPGPLAINSATFVGYKRCGVLGSVFATLGVVLPSFIIIYIIKGRCYPPLCNFNTLLCYTQIVYLCFLCQFVQILVLANMDILLLYFLRCL